MAKVSSGLTKSAPIRDYDKVTRQGKSKNTHYGASSRNGRKKPYRGQGKR